jgi:hypothetical protein
MKDLKVGDRVTVEAKEKSSGDILPSVNGGASQATHSVSSIVGA